MSKHKKRLSLIILFPLLLSLLTFGFANMPSLSNEVLKKQVVDQAGGNAQSTNYQLTAAIGQPGGIGAAVSANYFASGGFLAETPAAGPEGIIVSAPVLSGSAGSSIDVPITVTDLTDQNIIALDMTIETNTEVLTPTGMTTDGAILQAWSNVFANVNGGRISIAATDLVALSGSGTLVILHYDVNPQAAEGQSTTIHFANLLFNEGNPPAVPHGGLFTVSAGFTVSGSVKYYNNNNPVANTEMTLTGNTTTTGSDGAFLFSEIPGGNYTLTPDKDGAVGNCIGAFDAAQILRQSAGLISLTPYQLIAADVTGNGSVTSFDASYILRYSVGFISEFPVGKTWTFVPENFAINSTNWSSAPHSISYAPLDADQVNQDFYGIVYSDASGNWSPTNLAAPTKLLAGSAVVEFGELIRSQEQEISVPVYASVFGELLSARIDFSFDNSELKFTQVLPGKNLADFQFAHSVTEGKLTVAFAGALPVSSEVELFTLQFKPTIADKKSATFLEITETSLNEGQIAVSLPDASLRLNPVLPSKYSLSQNYPNPFNPSTTISYLLPVTSHVELTIYNITGQKIQTLISEQQQTGYYHVEWDATDFSGGVYLCRLQAADPAKAMGQNFVKVIKVALVK